ncbi:alanine racemase [Desulforhabdus amnigena]|uniref:Alanine racemase n=1 Tax=Desulforhabdus amnigena TaxID=40218 RepID=A0A9W6FU00_9BACT|nr:alanine racemase [Desulforhabdus amnigena]NLJ29266.1 alanine racemase [Deltaproteobacteria bacterium]GLI34855.1 alanine racemase [Desulforhabdus amnigena]
MYGPYITIDLEKIEHNARTITRLCRAHGIEVTGVTKVTCGMPQVAKAMLRGGVSSIGESRMKNIHRLKANGVNTSFMLLRIPPLSGADDIVASADISLNSELPVISALSDAACRRGLVHKIIIMVDLGDLREGVWPDDLLPFVRDAVGLPGIRIVGLGTNLSCYGGVIPTAENMNRLVEYACMIEKSFSIDLQYISGGNSSALNLIASGKMPKRINHVRIGEGILLGRETINRTAWPGTFQDAFMLHAEVIELKEKPSMPIGPTSEDAFGGKPVFEDKGEMIRAILNIGREDVDIEGIKPVDLGLSILGASSDHLILDVTRAQKAVHLGEDLAFSMNYGALLAAMTSQYVEKRPLRGLEMERLRAGVMILCIRGANGKAPFTVFDIERLEKGLKVLGYSNVIKKNISSPSGGETQSHERHSPSAENRQILEMAPAVADGVVEALAQDCIPLVLANDPGHCLGVYQGLARFLPSCGTIILSAHGGFMPPRTDVPLRHSALGSALGFDVGTTAALAGIQPCLQPEQVVLIGLREVEDEEAQRIIHSGITVYTMEEIDALGIREVADRALHTAGMGTAGIHLNLNMDVLDPGVAPAVLQPAKGGLSYREGHLVMEMIARSELLRSLAVVGFSQERDKNGSTERTAVEYILSLFGKKILGTV